jgi:prepilin-type N-terminal cleavage/methylation domain-containing protein
MRDGRQFQTGFTLIEVLISIAIAALLLTALTGLIGNVLESRDHAGARNDATRDARFAMQRMVTAVLRTERLMLPLADNPNTNWREHVREETFPASAPEGDSTRATAVLAVTLDPRLDIDQDGIADADNDGDGRVDEDIDSDNTFDAAPGIVGIDDDGDGTIDELESGSGNKDNDEDGLPTEDHTDGIDNDGDGSIDEDPGQDMNKDIAPGILGFDDDGDGSIDEGHQRDDDEDGLENEDWFDPVVFYLNGSDLIERRPNLAAADGSDYSEYVIAGNVTRFRVERIPASGRRSVLVDLTLEVAAANGEPVSLNTRIRAGAGR